MGPKIYLLFLLFGMMIAVTHRGDLREFLRRHPFARLGKSGEKVLS